MAKSKNRKNHKAKVQTRNNKILQEKQHHTHRLNKMFTEMLKEQQEKEQQEKEQQEKEIILDEKDGIFDQIEIILDEKDRIFDEIEIDTYGNF